jgi:hypothetical protein
LSNAVREKRTWWIVILSTCFLLMVVLSFLVSTLRRDSANRALAQAVGDHDIEGVRLALHRGANPNADIYEALLSQWDRIGHIGNKAEPPSVPVLLYATVDYRIPQTDPDTTLVRLLLEAGASPNCTNDRGETPLMTAACWGDRNHVRLLLKSGAQVNIRDHRGYTALHWARMPSKMSGHDKEVLDRLKSEVIEILKTAGAKE